MLIKESFIYFKDNSGCKKVKIFFKGKKKYISKLGVIKGSVKKAVSSGNGNQNDQKSNIKGSKKLPQSFAKRTTVEEHSKVKVLILSTKKEKSRKNGTYIRFPECRGLVINDEKKIAKTIATTISGIYPKELKKDRRYKVFALSRDITKKEKSAFVPKGEDIQREEEGKGGPLEGVLDHSVGRANDTRSIRPSGKKMISLRELIMPAGATLQNASQHASVAQAGHRLAQPWEKTTKRLRGSLFLPI